MPPATLQPSPLIVPSRSLLACSILPCLASAKGHIGPVKRPSGFVGGSQIKCMHPSCDPCKGGAKRSESGPDNGPMVDNQPRLQEDSCFCQILSGHLITVLFYEKKQRLMAAYDAECGRHPLSHGCQRWAGCFVCESL